MDSYNWSFCHKLIFKRFVLLFWLICILLTDLNAQTISATYPSDIATSFSNPPMDDPGCNGDITSVSIALPSEEDTYVITNANVSYDMEASGGGWLSEQRSKIRFGNTGAEKASYAEGLGDTQGILNYSRNLSLANGEYEGGTTLIFQMVAVRTWEGIAGCNASINKVNSNTFTVTVGYTEGSSNQFVGINTQRELIISATGAALNSNQNVG